MTKEDAALMKAEQYICDGWLCKLQARDEGLCLFFHKKNELICINSVIYWSHRAVILATAWKLMPHLLHNTHQGITATKNLARSLYCYQGLDRGIEDMARAWPTCIECSS